MEISFEFKEIKLAASIQVKLTDPRQIAAGDLFRLTRVENTGGATSHIRLRLDHLKRRQQPRYLIYWSITLIHRSQIISGLFKTC